MAKLYRHTFTVQGMLGFPIDMLRYDRCTPDSESDADRIERSVETAGNTGNSNADRIRLRRTCAERRWTPTIRRWHSFGWEVVAQEVMEELN